MSLKLTSGPQWSPGMERSARVRLVPYVPFLTSEDDNVVGRHSSILESQKINVYKLI